MPTLLLVDGSSYLYRAFHAMPDLRTSQNEPTGAIHGVLNMLRRLESDYQAAGIDYKGCVFDAKGGPFVTTGTRSTRRTARRCPRTWCARSNPCTRPSWPSAGRC
jgi:5'-3' exonuclease